MRNAFGNYRDIALEVSANPLMGAYLTITGNRAATNAKTAPNENYARELMQLFTIGHYELEPDGKRIVNPTTGKYVETYTSDDIFTLARCWTGFSNKAFRRNIASERTSRGGGAARAKAINLIDQLQVLPDQRDTNPKTSLGNGYLGGQSVRVLLHTRACLKMATII